MSPKRFPLHLFRHAGRLHLHAATGTATALRPLSTVPAARSRTNSTDFCVEDYLAYDQKHVMHPYTSMTDPLRTHLVSRAQGVHIYLEGKSGEVEVIDGMSSWWAAVHGHRNPSLDAALKRQIDSMSHVMFGGLCHRPAVDLCKLLVEVTPQGLDKVFLCDSGSVSVEVAMKMAVQYWFTVGRPERSRFMTIRNSYHGDTFGAMSVCDPVNSMHSMFSNVLPRHLFVESPCKDEQRSLEEMRQALQVHEGEVAAVILEPIVQGAGGMNFYSAEYLSEVRAMCDEFDILLILDEIATGFGRTGTLFACDQGHGVVPDIMCLGKALTGGYMTMGATLTNRKVSEGISGKGGVFMHGPTFMGNPLAASVAHASVSLLVNSPWQSRVQSVEKKLREGILHLDKYPAVNNTRVLGAIGVCELHEPVRDVASMQDKLISRGVWLRPFGKLLYTMPPFNTPITDDQVEQITSAMEYVVSEL